MTLQNQQENKPRYPRRPGFTGAESPAGSTPPPAVTAPPRRFIERKAPELFSFKAEGDLLEGVLLRIDAVTIKDKQTHQPKRVSQFTFRRESGDAVKILGTYDLDCKIFHADIGVFMEVIYVGENKEIKRGNNYMRVFKVNIEDAPPEAPAKFVATDEDIGF